MWAAEAVRRWSRVQVSQHPSIIDRFCSELPTCQDSRAEPWSLLHQQKQGCIPLGGFTYILKLPLTQAASAVLFSSFKAIWKGVWCWGERAAASQPPITFALNRCRTSLLKSPLHCPESLKTGLWAFKSTIWKKRETFCSPHTHTHLTMVFGQSQPRRPHKYLNQCLHLQEHIIDWGKQLC